MNTLGYSFIDDNNSSESNNYKISTSSDKKITPLSKLKKRMKKKPTTPIIENKHI